MGTVLKSIRQFKPDEPLELEEIDEEAFPLALIELFREEENGKQSVASLDLALVNGTRDYNFYDSSVRDANDRYKVLGTASVTIKGAPKFSEELMDTIESLGVLFKKANILREKSFERWLREFMPHVIHPGIKWFFLRRFTLKWTDKDALDDVLDGGQVSADFFIEKWRFLPPIEKDFLEYMYSHMCEVYGMTIEDVEAILLSDDSTETDLYNACQVVAMILLSGALATYYSGDKADKLSVERFTSGVFSREKQGDCEDDAQSIFIFFHWVRESDFFPGLVRLLNTYEMGLCTGVATYGNLTSQSFKSEEFICHVWAMMIPKVTMNLWLPKPVYNVEDPLCNRVKVMMMEGTASAPVFGLEKSYYLPPDEATKENARIVRANELEARVVAKIPQLKGTRPIGFKPTTSAPKQVRDLSEFYVYVISMWIVSAHSRCYHFMRDNKIGVELFYPMRADSKIRLLPQDDDVPFTELERKALVSFDTALLPLTKLEEVTSDTEGVRDRDNMVEFHYQKEIPNVVDKLKKIPGYSGHSLRCITLYESCVLHILQVFFESKTLRKPVFKPRVQTSFKTDIQRPAFRVGVPAAAAAKHGRAVLFP